MRIRPWVSFVLVVHLLYANCLIAATSISLDPLQKIAEEYPFLAKLSGIYKNYYPDPPYNGGGVRAELSYVKSHRWALRGKFYALHLGDDTGYQGTLGGSYWPADEWVVTLDSSYSPNVDLFPELIIDAGVTYNGIRAVSPSLDLVYARDGQDSVFVVPSLMWSVVPSVTIEGRFFAGYSVSFAQEGVTAFAGSLRFIYSPVKRYSFELGTIIGNTSFDRGIPKGPLVGIISEILSGLIAVPVYQGFGLEGVVAYEWQSDGGRYLTARLAATYIW